MTYPNFLNYKTGAKARCHRYKFIIVLGSGSTVANEGHPRRGYFLKTKHTPKKTKKTVVWKFSQIHTCATKWPGLFITNHYYTMCSCKGNNNEEYDQLQVRLRVRFHLCGTVAERSPLGGGDFWLSVFSCCVFPLRRCGGGAEAGVRGGSAEWVLEPFFRSALRSGSGLETIGIDSLEVSKPLYWYKKYPDRSVYWQENQLLCCCSVCGISERLESFKYQSPGFGISQNVRIRHLNSLLNI